MVSFPKLPVLESLLLPTIARVLLNKDILLILKKSVPKLTVSFDCTLQRLLPLLSVDKITYRFQPDVVLAEGPCISVSPLKTVFLAPAARIYKISSRLTERL